MAAANLEGAVPSHLPVLPLKSTVVFPRIFIPLSVGRRRSLTLLDDLPGAERHIAVATQLDETAEEVGFKDIHHIGAMVRVQHMLKLPDGTVQLAVLGLRRIKLVEAESEDPYLTCAVEMLPEQSEDILTIEREALMRRGIHSVQQLVALAPHLPAELAGAAGAIDDPLHLAYYIANNIRLTTEQRQEILELESAKAKLERLLGHMSHELEVLELGRKIQSQAEEQMGKAQREDFLREQLKAIQRELGELDTEHAELSELRERIEKAGLPLEAKREADREIGRLERIPSASPESSVIRTYLELMVSLPWNVSTGGEVDVKKSREILDADHYDLDKVKQRIVEHLAVRRLKQVRGSTDRGREPILCFVGPPGVGKTSLGQSIARAMGRKFARASLGGVHDEAEKVQIAERFLIPKQVSAHGLRDGEVTISEDALRLIIRDYTREAGVRNLEREIASLIRRDVAEIAAGKRLKRMDDAKKVRAALGKRRFYDDVAERIDRPGVATGLVWTPTGGGIIFVEGRRPPRDGGLRSRRQVGEGSEETDAARRPPPQVSTGRTA